MKCHQMWIDDDEVISSVVFITIGFMNCVYQMTTYIVPKVTFFTVQHVLIEQICDIKGGGRRS